jgi:peptide/nickel transport system substrate-binding protein
MVFPKCWRILSACGLYLSVSILVGCIKQAKSAAPREYLTISSELHAAWARNFNPLLPVNTSRWSATASIYEPLFIFNRQTATYVPWLGLEQHYEDESYLKLLVKLRPEVRWSDGKSFGPKDVAFTFNLLKLHPAADLNGVGAFLERVESASEDSVRFIFKKPYSPGFTFIAHQPILAEHIWSHVKDPISFANENPVGTGPFTEVTLFQPQVYQLDRNPHYWQPGKPAVKGLRFPAYPSNDQVMLALLKGQLDLSANFIPAIERLYVSKDPEHNKYWFQLIGAMVFLYFNTTEVPFNDAAVRKALSQAIDRDKIVKIAIFDYSVPGHPTGLSDGFAKWRLKGELPAGYWTGFNPVAAERALDELGFKKDADGKRHLPSGEKWTFDVNVVSGWSDWVRAAMIIVKSLNAIGIDAKLKTLDFAAWFEKVQRGEFAASLGWALDTTDPFHYYRWLMSGETVLPVGQLAAGNWHRFADPKADKVLAKLSQTFEENEKKNLIFDLQRIFMADAPALPLFPNPAWGEAHTKIFEGFPSPENPYAVLSPNYIPEILQVLTNVRPLDVASRPDLRPEARGG